MDEHDVRQAFRTTFDGARPSAGAADRAFAAVAASGTTYGLGRRLAGAAAVALAILVVATLLIARGALLPRHAVVPAAGPVATPTPASTPRGTAGLVNRPPQALVVAGSDQLVLAGWTESGLLSLTADGGATWTPLHVPAGQVYDAQFADIDTVLVSTDTGLFRYQRSTAAWTRLSSRTDLVRLDFANPSSGYAVTALGAVVRTQDAGQTLTAVDVGLHPVTWIQRVSATHAWAAGPQGVVATVDGGTTWIRQLSFPASTHGPGTGGVAKVQVGFRDETNGFAVVEFDGGATAAHVLYHTSDGGATWTAESCTCHSAPPDWLGGGQVTALPYPSGDLVVTGDSSAMLVGTTALAGGVISMMCTTTDAGRDWSCDPLPYAGDASAALAARGQARWLALMGSTGALLATSPDAGATWTDRRP